jgi:hypothetical protein
MMNLVFDLQNDKNLRDGGFWRPHKLVSLWDMYPLRARKFAETYSQLVVWGTLVKTNKASRPRFQSVLAQEVDKTTIENFYNDLLLMEMNSSAAAAKRFLELLNSNKSPSVLEDELFVLLGRVHDDLTGRLFLVMSPTTQHYFDLEGTFLGKELIDKFADSDLPKDASKAGNCFALGEHTACVFHLMRIMERLVQDFATKLGAILTHKGEPINIEYAEWNQIENAIKPIIEDMRKGERKNRCNAALEALGAIRLGIRNEIMHPRGFYDEEDARRLMANVKSFVQEVTTLSTL